MQPPSQALIVSSLRSFCPGRTRGPNDPDEGKKNAAQTAGGHDGSGERRDGRAGECGRLTRAVPTVVSGVAGPLARGGGDQFRPVVPGVVGPRDGTDAAA